MEISPFVQPDNNVTMDNGSNKRLSIGKTFLDKVTWESDNETIATVNEKGIVQATNYGDAVITATVVHDKDDLVVSYKFSITVK